MAIPRRPVPNDNGAARRAVGTLIIAEGVRRLPSFFEIFGRPVLEVARASDGGTCAASTLSATNGRSLHSPS